jgi:hypothetical protein
MTLDEKSINALNEYFAEIAQNAINTATEETDEETTFSEFMDNLTNLLHQFSSEHVATEVLGLSARAIEKYNNGSGMYVDDVQALIEEKEDGYDDDEEDEEEVDYDD